jgi:hypothetical protein
MMEEIYYISQIVAVVVIVATLFAILWQGYQTNKIARANLTLSMWMQTGMMHYSLYDNPEKADFMHRAMYGLEPLKDGERDRLYTALGMAIGTFEAAFNLRRRGLVEEAAYQRNAGTTRLYFQSPRVRKWWRLARTNAFTPEFRDALDAIAREIEGGAADRTAGQDKTA